MSQIVNIADLPNFYKMGSMPKNASDSSRINMRMVLVTASHLRLPSASLTTIQPPKFMPVSR